MNMKKTVINKRALTYYMLALLVFFLIINFLVINQQRELLVSENDIHTENEVLFFSKLIRFSLIKSDYVNIEESLSEWAKDNEHIIKLSLKIKNDFILAEYSSNVVADKVKAYTHEIPYGSNSSATLLVTMSQDKLYEHLVDIAINLVVSSIVLVLVFGFFLWRILLKTAIAPLQYEILEHKRTSDELRKSKLDADRATQLKSEFLANMSHELRTPMNSIIGFTGRVIKKSADKLDDRQLKNLKTVERNAHHLLGLINGLLDISKVEAGKMEAYPEPFDFVSLANEVVLITSPMLEGKDIELIVDLPSDEIILNTDSIKLKQVLINLVSNAVKFTASGSITITAKLFKNEREKMINIRVSDTGLGMNEESLKYIFDAFRQVDGAMTRQVGGTGLGLAIVKHFSELLRGSVCVESKEGRGTAFEIVLPVSFNTKVKNNEKSDLIKLGEGGSNKKTILCIDDESDVLELLSGYLIDEGYQVITASNPDQGLVLAKKWLPFAITLDILMPYKDGWSVLSELKADGLTRDIPVFIISFLDNKAMGYQLGAFDYMQKPVSPERLISGVNRLIKGSVKKVLIVDDDDEARDLMQQILSEVGINTEPVVDGNDALSVLQKPADQLPDLILLDLMMPGMDGFELIEEIQKSDALSAIPIIVVTAKSLEEHERDFLLPKVKGILAKDGLTAEIVLKQLVEAMKHFDR